MTEVEELYAEVPDCDEGDPEWRETGDIEAYDARKTHLACNRRVVYIRSGWPKPR
jgi:hypothetical protein